jgi:hypothetical protein
MRNALLTLLCLATLTLSATAQERTEDVRLKGRGAGRGVALFWNNTDDGTRRMIIVVGSVLLLSGLGFGVRHFIRETRELRAPCVKQPWDL